MTQTQTQAKPKFGVNATVLAILAAAALKLKALSSFGFSLITMILSIGVFAMSFGLPYAVGLVLVIFIHESGHWIWMKAAGLNPKGPVFIPGIGAYVAMTNMPASEAMHAWVALAGPLIGGLGCAVLFLIGIHTNNGWLMACAQTGFWLNLVQLIPAKPLDGGFVVNAISKWFLIPGTILLFIFGFFTGSPLIFIIAIMSLLSWRRPKASVATTVPSGKSVATLGQSAAEPSTKEQSATQPSIEQQPPAQGADLDVSAPQPYQPAPATGWERVAIALAYLSLIVVLAVCNLLSSGEVSALTHH